MSEKGLLIRLIHCSLQIMKKLKWTALIFLAVFGLIQIISVERTNPPVQKTLKMPSDVEKIVKTSCFDCHSNETEWPWYSAVAPVSWLLVNHVNEGREHLNFSEWYAQSSRKREKLPDEIIEEIEEGEMPMPLYLPLHEGAEVTSAELKTLRNFFLDSRNFTESGK